MEIALIIESPESCKNKWRRHPELYTEDVAQIRYVGEVLSKYKVKMSTWNTIEEFLEHRSGNEIVFTLVENCFERNCPCLIPSLWEMLKIPYVGSDPYAAMVTSDKKLFQEICQNVGLKCPKCIEFDSNATKDLIAEKIAHSTLSYPLLLKYRYGTMSYGLCTVNDLEELSEKVLALVSEEKDSPILCEEYIHGRDISVPIVGTGRTAEILSIIEYTGPDNKPLYIYDTKWKNEFDNLVSLHPLDQPELAEVIETQCLFLHQYLKIRDMCRIDLRVTDSGEVFFLEANCIPSLGIDGAFDLASYGYDLSLESIIIKIINSACLRYGERIENYEQ